MDYNKDLLDDAVTFLEDMKDEIKVALISDTEFGDIDNGDIRYRMEESIYTPFSLKDAVFVIDNCENDETDDGLWEGLDAAGTTIRMAEYSYIADAWFKAEELYNEMLCALDEYLEDFTRSTDEDVENATDIIWNGFIDRHTIQPVETGGITELTILEHWVRLNKDSGMWSGYPFGGAYIDARYGAGYEMPDVKNFVDCDRTVRYQLPHMAGKYCADVELRIDELKEATITDSEKRHAKLDEVIDDARKEMHRMMDKAVLSGAVSDEMLRPDTYSLARAIFTIYGDERNHASPSIIMNKEIDNLSKML